MNRKKFHEMVGFSLALNEWAATQPGYKSPVTNADVEEVMVKIRPMLKKTEPKSEPIAPESLKYSVLVRHIEKERPKNKPSFSMKLKGVTKLQMSERWRQIERQTSIENWRNMEEKLVEEKMLVPVKSKGRGGVEKFTVTESGRRFVRDIDRKQKTGK
jgi:YesN/AraC family two-component response regulator